MKATDPGIYPKGKGLWKITISLGKDAITGKYRQQSHFFKGTKEDAKKKRAALLNQHATGTLPVDPDRWTVAGYLDHWLDTYAAQNCDTKTESTYRSILKTRVVPLLGAVLLAKLTPAHLRQAYATLLTEGRAGVENPKPLAPRSVQHTHRVLSEALGHAVKWQLLPRNVADAVDPPKAKSKEMKTWNAEQARRFLDLVTARTDDGEEAVLHGTAMAVALLTGARQGEVLGLRWQDVDLGAGTIGITQTVKRVHEHGIVFGSPKTARSRRRIDLEPVTVELLRAHRTHQKRQKMLLGPGYEDAGLVFATPLGTPVDPCNLTHSFYRAAIKLGLPRIRFHDLRHTHATLMLSQNENPKVVSERLGHASIAITMDTYSHAVPGMQKAAAARLGALLWGTGTEG